MFSSKSIINLIKKNLGGDSILIHKSWKQEDKNNFLKNFQVYYTTNSLPQKAQIIVCGAGVVGSSVAYHLNQNNCEDVIVVEQNKIGSGVSSRSCGVVSYFHALPEAYITKYSSELYKAFESQGYNVGFKETGSLNLARTKERMVELRRSAAEARIQGLTCEILGPNDVKELHPFVKPEGIEGAVWVPGDGTVNPFFLCSTLARITQDKGVKYFEGCRILEILTNGIKVTGVKTNLGIISCEYLVLCAGMVSRVLGLNCLPPFRIPTQTVKNPYVVTKPIPSVSPNVPILKDYDAGFYTHEYEGGFLIGGFSKEAKPFSDERLPSQYDSLTNDWSYFKPVYEEACRRIPILNQAEGNEYISELDTFTPDGQWILGETAEIDNLYVAVGTNGNSTEAAGGLGKELADWITTGEPKSYLLSLDIRRFIDLHNNPKFLKERVQESIRSNYHIRHPLLSEFNTARKTRCSPLYTVQDQAGAVFGERMGFERVLYFDPTKSIAERHQPLSPTYGKPPWFDNVQEEYNACRERVGIIDMSSFTKFHLKSGNTEVVDFLQLLCSNDIDVPTGNIVSSGMQNEQGGYENDCMLLRNAHNCYFMMSPTAQHTRVNEFMRRHLPSNGSVSIRDVTSMYTVLNVVGPKSKELMAELTRTEMDIPSFTCKKMNVGYASEVLVMAFNNTGEPGYTLYIPSEYALHVYNNLLSAGRDYGVRNVGYYTLRFLRIEKFIPFWAEELDSHTTPFEVGRGFKVKLQKPSFIGKRVLQEQVKSGLKRRLLHFVLDGHNHNTDLWPWGREPIFRNGQYVGKTTSSGFGFALNKIICLGFVNNEDGVTSDFITKEAHFEVEIAGKRFTARASLHPPQIPIVSMNGASNKYTPTARQTSANA